MVNLEIMNREKSYNIVLSCDDNYSKYTYITIFSMIKNKRNNYTYNVHILADTELSEINKALLLSLGKIDVMIYIHKIEEEFVESIIKDHLGIPAYYRLLIPKVLHVKQCLYLDSDIIVNDDIIELLDMELHDSYLIAGKQIGNRILPEEIKKQAAIRHEIPSMDHYIQSGVLLMNLELMRQDGLVKQFMELTKTEWSDMDQSILNKVCYGRIEEFPYRYNIGVGYFSKLGVIKKVFSDDEIKEAHLNPCILHFAEQKPWKELNSPLSKIWWEYAKETPLYNQFCEEAVEYLLAPQFNQFVFHNCFDDVISTWKQYPIIVYGAGKVGKEVLCILKSRMIEPIYFAVSSMENHETVCGGVEIRPIESLIGYANKCLVLIATTEQFHLEIKKKLDYYYFKYCVIDEVFLWNCRKLMAELEEVRNAL